MPDDQQWAELITGLRAGDADAARAICQQYLVALEQYADRHLAQAMRRRIGPEDVVQSACRTFFRRARLGQFELKDSAELWNLLSAITLTKLRQGARFHLRDKRNLGREQQLNGESGNLSRPEMAGRDVPPGDAAAFAEQLEQLFAVLDDEQRQLVELKLQQFTNEEAAEKMGCSERTVRRLLERVRTQLTRQLADD